MPVPTSRTDLSTTPGDNSPNGSEVPFPSNLKNYLRTLAAFIAQNYADIGTLQTSLTARLPAGCVLLWSGSTASIPSGWVICDGTNGTPDLRNRFIVGAGSTYSVGATGGATSTTTDSQGAHTHSGNVGATTLDITQIPSHTHGGVPASMIDVDRGSGNASLFSLDDTGNTSAAGGGASHTHTISSDGAHTHSVATLPPYYALAYIMKT